MTQKEQLMINEILESIGLESIKSSQSLRPIHEEE
jgi:hypothetical protein